MSSETPNSLPDDVLERPHSGQIIYYDYEHCRGFLEQRAADLKEKAKGLETLAVNRELYYSFAYEAMEQNAIALGQFEAGMVFLFIPDNLSPARYADGNSIAREKAVELLNTPHPPVAMELLSAQRREPVIGERGRIERWMRPEFLNDVILSQRVHIHIYFDGFSFFEQLMKPALIERNFEVLDTYVASAKSEVLRVRHPNTPGKIVKIPWMMWLREMMGGGYSSLYLMACYMTYLQKMQAAVEGVVESSR